jgi:hypothetical protein
MSDVPYFEVNSDSTDFNLFASGPIVDTDAFYKRLYEFIYANLNSTYKSELLCYLVSPGGIIMEATLDEGSYMKSLQKCVEYYRENEEYETCNKIKKLIEKHGL